VNKIIPLVLVVSLSLIFGTQAAYAQTDVWAFYGEIGGSKIDATNPGKACPTNANTCSESDDILGDGTKFFVGHTEFYQNVASANTFPEATLKGPIIQATCFANAANPVSGAFSWNFDTLTQLDCVQNQRADVDLGLGVDESPNPTNAPEDEVEVGEIVVLDLEALLGNYKNFMFRISSNSQGEQGWAAVSDSPPQGTLNQGAFDLLGANSGLFSGDNDAGDDFNDTYISFTPKRYFYYSQTLDNSDNILQQIKAEKDMVGGYGGITDNTALLVSGSHLTASWMIPLIVSAIGIAVFVVTRKQS